MMTMTRDDLIRIRNRGPSRVVVIDEKQVINLEINKTVIVTKYAVVKFPEGNSTVKVTDVDG